MSSDTIRRWSVPTFLIFEAVLYLSFLTLDLTQGGAGTFLLKYSSIALCALMMVTGAFHGGDRLVAAALLLTLCADTLMFLLDRWYLAGLLLFYGVQVLYLLRIGKANGGHILLIPRMLLFLLLLLALIRLKLFTPLSALAALYLAHALCNVVLSFSLHSGCGKLFSAGLVLFLCCNLCMGVFHFPQFFPRWLFSFSRVGIWMFYLPGQVLIALSGLTIPVRGVPYEAQ